MANHDRTQTGNGDSIQNRMSHLEHAGRDLEHRLTALVQSISEIRNENLKYHEYILMQHELMVKNPKLYSERGKEAARRQAGYELAAMGMGSLKIHNSEMIPFPAPIEEREKFAKWSRSACTTLYLTPTIVAGILICWNLWKVQMFTLFQGGCLAVAAMAVIYQQRASTTNSGLFYLISSLESSLSKEKRLFRMECFKFYESMQSGSPGGNADIRR